ncbi:MAG: hypothetical protein FWD34_05840 [Oscillospiraceae bacterium]|nr:hypothetical protein [Oscillospiraceae bacterium]
MQFKRKSFLKLLLLGIGYMVMGNLMATIMMISLGGFAMSVAIMSMAALFAAVIYLSLVFIPAYKDGMTEHAALLNKRVESVPKFRWMIVGVILFVISIVPTILFMLGIVNAGVFRIISGAVYPLSLLLTGEELVILPFAPFVFLGFYTLTIPACHLGFWCGVNDKLNSSKIMYK